MRNVLVGLAAVIVLILGVAAPTLAGQDKVVICHASGLAGTTKFETLELAYPAVYGQGGHFNNDGTPQAGHEDDYLGACTAEATPSPSPSSSPTSEPSTSPSPSPTESPVVSPDPSPSAAPTLPATDTNG